MMISSLREEKERFFSLSPSFHTHTPPKGHMSTHGEGGCPHTRNRPLPRPKSASTLILDLPDSRTMRDKRLLLKPLNLGILFCQLAKTEGLFCAS